MRIQFLNHDNQLTPDPNIRCCDASVLASDSEQREDQRFCFNIDVHEDEFYKDLMVRGKLYIANPSSL